jgi:quercetin dioxygenase-like cupin family protein
MKSLRIHLLISYLFLIFIACKQNPNQNDHTHDESKEHHSETVHKVSNIDALKINNILRDSLGLREGIEVILSYIEIPKNSTLPTHFHPGEEFVYMLEGSGELTFNKKTKITIKAGDAIKVPLKEVHSFSTLNEAARAVVFRVHEKGQPDRILVE